MNTENVNVNNSDYSNKLRENNQATQQRQRKVDDENIEFKTRQNALRLQNVEETKIENKRLDDNNIQKAQEQIANGYLDVKV